MEQMQPDTRQDSPAVPGRAAVGTCARCGRPLKDPVSIVRGLGPVCARVAGPPVPDVKGDCEPLLFEPRAPFNGAEIRVWRRRDGAVDASITLNCVHHSPTGWECGYGGSGPADLALNILNVFLPPGCDGEEPVKLRRGRCSATAWKLHQSFKRDFIANLGRSGGVIPAERIRAWIDLHTQKGGEA